MQSKRKELCYKSSHFFQLFNDKFTFFHYSFNIQQQKGNIIEKKRKVIDCRWFPSETKCSLAISGNEEEVVKAATEHAISCHKEKNTLELQKEIRKCLKDAKD